ncbi:hypothetical protein Syun_012153 [Stephania yunnanensis]|uniref:Uncharacterized protein n=1 Tax=Stephania yunnanensis TaxID=152371 RepID=A0AAP0JYW5_9MAGN
MMKREENGHAESSKEWLEDVRDGRLARDFEITALQGLQVVRAQKGSMRCNFTVPKAQSDEYGNWVAGAMAALIDDVGAADVVSIVYRLHVSVSFDISFFSTAKIQSSPSLCLHEKLLETFVFLLRGLSLIAKSLSLSVVCAPPFDAASLLHRCLASPSQPRFSSLPRVSIVCFER